MRMGNTEKGKIIDGTKEDASMMEGEEELKRKRKIIDVWEW